MAWQPVLEGADARRAFEAAVALSRALEARPAAGARGPLAEAHAERALVHGYLDAALPGQGHREAALRALDAAVDAAAGETLPPALFGGFAGVAWIAAHLQQALWGGEAELDE